MSIESDRGQFEPRKTPVIEQLMEPYVDPVLRRAGKKRAKPPSVHVSDPVAELRRLVGMHRNLAGEIQRYTNGNADRTFKPDDGEEVIIKCAKSPAAIHDCKRAIATMKQDQGTLEKLMVSELKTTPIYQEFLGGVYGVGPVTAAYIVAMVRIEKCPNFSNLNRYCGNAPDAKTGWRENRNGAAKMIGGEGTFNSTLRRNNYLIMTSMRKNSAKFTACEVHEDERPSGGSPAAKLAFRQATAECSDCLATARPFGTTSKYLERWLNASHTERTMPTAPRPGYNGKMRSPIPDAKGRMKATDLFLWDLYVMWRALKGLDMRHDVYSCRRGFTHDGTPVTHEVRFSLSVGKAKEMVGHVGGQPSTRLMAWKATPEEVDGEES